MDTRKYKTEFKWFTIPQWEEEEQYLTEMNKQGWEFSRVTFPGFYRFIKTQPAEVIYKLDYNQEGLSNKSEYLQLFSDCGWQYLCEFVGYTYFRKKLNPGEDPKNEDIFSDDDSRLDMIKRVFKGRMIPAIVIFFCCILPQLTMNYFGETVFNHFFFVLLFLLLIIYLIMFANFGFQYFKLKKRMGK